MNHFRAVCISRRQREVHEVQQDEVELDEYTEKGGQTDIVNIIFTNSNVKIQA